MPRLLLSPAPLGPDASARVGMLLISTGSRGGRGEGGGWCFHLTAAGLITRKRRRRWSQRSNLPPPPSPPPRGSPPLLSKFRTGILKTRWFTWCWSFAILNANIHQWFAPLPLPLSPPPSLPFSHPLSLLSTPLLLLLLLVCQLFGGGAGELVAFQSSSHILSPPIRKV